jgi:hypothetical protein
MNVENFEKRFFSPSRTAKITAVNAAIAFTSLGCCVLFGQEPQPAKNQTEKALDFLRGMPSQEEYLTQLGIRVENLDYDVRKARENLGPTHPSVIHAEKELETTRSLFNLQKRLVELSHGVGEPSENKKAEMSQIASQISAITLSRFLAFQQVTESQPSNLMKELQQTKMQLAERERQLAAVAKEMEEQQRRHPPLPPLENGTVKVYTLQNLPARDVSRTIEQLFGSALRIAVDERTNSLIAFGKEDSLKALDPLLARFGEMAPAKDVEKTKQGATMAPRSLLLRVFWLADDIRDGKPAGDFLPEDVLRAAIKLGLEKPRLVTQTVNSLAVGRDESVDFSTNVPAVLAGEPNGLSCEGRLKMIGEDRVRLEMGVHAGSPATNISDLKGSLTIPLGHYMVLGTANSLIAEGGASAAQNTAAQMGPGPGGMRPRYSGTIAGPEGGGSPPGRGFGPEGGPVAGGTITVNRGPVGPGGVQQFTGNVTLDSQQPKPNFKSSLFAFVVQVIDAESYSGKKSKSAGSKQVQENPFE